MKTDFMKKASPLMIAFALVACESSHDVARKPNVAEPIVQTALQKCEIRADDEAYAMRLRKVLMDARTTSLEILKSKNATVCLDARLDAQENGVFDSVMLGKLYNGDTANPVISLFDNGKVGSQGSIWKLDTDDNGGESLNTLAELYSDGKVSPQQSTLYAGSYTYYYGNNTYVTEIEWRKPQNFDKATIAKNPQLNTPPLRAVSFNPGV